MSSEADKTKDPVLSELARGASLAFANAVDLLREAKALSACGAYSRALFLHQISLEECGKTEMIGWWATGHLMGTTVDFGKMRARFSSHKAKNFANAYMLPLCEAQQKARDESDWQREHQAFKEQQSAFHQQSNENKNASLYVDLIDGQFAAPVDRITEEMLHAVAEDNQAFIELMRPKVEMLASWTQYPDRVRASFVGFPERMAALCEEHPDDPRRAMDIILGELLGNLKVGQQHGGQISSEGAPSAPPNESSP
ncbi:MAG: AbiV family abortive infection protein [Thermoguttaceae bacterium]|nr:AbiV family abortive infection protein [Thermoguttaceae bacterium]